MPPGCTVNSETYSYLLAIHSKIAIKSKPRAPLISGGMLQHNNACSICCVGQLKPPRRLNFSVRHIHHIHLTSHNRITTFLPASGGPSFCSDEDVKEAVHEWPRTRLKDLFSAGTLVQIASVYINIFCVIVFVAVVYVVHTLPVGKLKQNNSP